MTRGLCLDQRDERERESPKGSHTRCEKLTPAWLTGTTDVRCNSGVERGGNTLVYRDHIYMVHIEILYMDIFANNIDQGIVTRPATTPKIRPTQIQGYIE